MPKPNSFLTTRELSIIFLFLIAVFALGLRAQTGQTATPQQAPRTAPQVEKVLPSYEGQNVTSVELAGQPNLNPNTLLPQLPIRAGEPFSQEKVNASTAALKKLGGYQAVEVEVRPEADGVRVLLVLQPAIYFGIYRFPGAEKQFAYSRLVQIADYPPRGAYTIVDVRNAEQALETFFKRNGYFRAQIHPVVLVDKQRGLANVMFNTDLGRHAKFGNVEIEGTTPEETAYLQKKLHSFMARLKGAAIRRGKPYRMKTLENAAQRLENTLMSQDHLAAKVKLIGASYDAETNHADIKFNVQPGPLVGVKIEGAHVWGRTQKKLLPLYQALGLDPELIQEGRQNLISHFQSKGFFDAQVTVDEQPQPDGGEMVVYHVTKGPKHKVDSVKIAGAQKLDEDELMPHVKIEKGNFLSHGQYSEKLVRTSVANLKRVYAAEGFSSVQITPQVTTDPKGNIDVVLRVNEGPQDIVESLKLEGNTVPETQLAPQGLKLTEGQPYSAKHADDDRNEIMAQYLRMGYLNATFKQTALPVDKDKHRLAVVYHIEEGPRVQTATISILGDRDTRASLIDKEANLHDGTPLREDELLMSESKLYNLGIFDWAEIDPRRMVTTQTQEDVVIKVHEARRNQITYGFGFEVVNRGGSVPSGTVALPNLPPVGLPSSFKTSEKTFWGPRGNFEYTRKNVRGEAESITVGALAGRLDQRVNFAYTIPRFRGSQWTESLTVFGEHDSQNPIFNSKVAEGGTQFQRSLDAAKTKTVILRYSLRETGLSNLLIPQLVPPEDLHVRLSTLSGTFIRDTRDNQLDAHKGFYETVQFDLNPAVLGSSVSFAKLLGQAAYYRKLMKVGESNIVWANSVRLGLEQPFDGSHVPLSEKFFTGGGSTLRGFPLNGAGPQHSIPACGTPGVSSTCSFIRVPVGGPQLFLVNSEFRIPVPYDLPLVHKNLGIATFYDGGNVFDRIGFHNFRQQYTNTVGIGLRYATPVGPVRVDFGHNLNSQTGIKSNEIFVTLGQAF
jgi:outer membrane protein insertion porin family